MSRASLLLVCALGACKGHEETTSLAPQASASAATPVDHLAPNELLEGSASIFGLKLPRGMQVDAAFQDVAFASGAAPLDGVVQFVRARVREGTMVQPSWDHPYRTTFDHVRVPALPDKELVIQVQPKRGMVGTTEIQIRDVTAAPAPKLPDEAARWAAAGLKPNGELLDPSRAQ